MRLRANLKPGVDLGGWARGCDRLTKNFEGPYWDKTLQILDVPITDTYMTME